MFVFQIIGIIVAFTLIIVMVNKKIALGYALITGSLIVGIFSGLGLQGVTQAFIAGIIDPITIRLVAVLALIGVLGNVMQEMKVLEKLVKSLNKVLRSAKLTLTVIPSIMGTLLVTGGAVMAAPLVDEISSDLDLPKPKRAAINLIFRHGWYFIYPLMPAFVLLSETASVDKFDVIKLQWPMTVAMIASGYWMWVRPAKAPAQKKSPLDKTDILSLIKYSAPLWVSLSLALGLEKIDWSSMGLSASFSSAFTQIAFPLALVFGIAIAIMLGDRGEQSSTLAIKNGIKIPIIISGLGIMIFKSMIGQLTVISSMVEALLNTGIPLYLIFITLPWLTGFLSASTTSAIGITVPILLPALAIASNPLPLIMLLYTSSFLGYLVSPLHLCQVLTLEYFDVKMGDLYKQYLIPIPLTFITALIVYAIVH